MPRTLILEPTRELAAQVKEQFDKYGAGQKLNVALLIGGVSFGDQDTKLTRGVDVLIATPGRLLDHTERGGLLLTGVEQRLPRRYADASMSGHEPSFRIDALRSIVPDAVRRR